MILVFIIDAFVAISILYVGITKSFERALPLAAFYFVLFPEVSRISISGVFDITTQRLVTILLVVLYFTIRKPSEQTKFAAPLKGLILFQLFWMCVAAANSVVFTTSLKTVLSQMLDFYVTYFIFVKSISRQDTVRRILLAMVAGMTVCCVFGAIEAYAQWSVLTVFPSMATKFAAVGENFITDRGVRVQSTFSHPILFGGAIAMALPMALYLIAITKNRTKRLLLWVSVLLMFLNVYKTMSRGPWLATAIALCLLLCFSRNRVRKYLTVIAVLAVVVLVARPGVWETIRDLYGSTLDPDSVQGESYEWRYAVYHIANRELHKSLERALWGYGPESFFYLGLAGEFQGKVVKFESCDSSVAELMIETGYVGFAIIALILGKAAQSALRNWLKLKHPSNELCIVLLASMCAFFFLMTNVAILAWGQQAYMLWITIAISGVYPRLARTAERKTQRLRVASMVQNQPAFAIEI